MTDFNTILNNATNMFPPADNTIVLKASNTEGTKVRLNHDRDEVPSLLKGKGVTLPQWQSTHDDLVSVLEYENRTTNSLLLFIPCLLMVMVPVAMFRYKRSANDWGELTYQEMMTYKPMGIKVSLMTDMFQRPVGRRGLGRNVGLRFNVLGDDAQASAIPVFAPPNLGAFGPMDALKGMPPMANFSQPTAGNGVVQQLEALKQMHENGTLSKAEYDLAKSKVLGI